MNDKKDFDKGFLGFVIGGAVLGAVAGYVVKKVGPKNIMEMIKRKDIIPPSITNLMNEFSLFSRRLFIVFFKVCYFFLGIFFMTMK